MMKTYSSKSKFSAFSFQLSALIFFSLIFNLPSSIFAGDMDQAIVHYNRGYDYYKKGEYDKAIEELENSLKFDADNENAHYGLGNCYYRKQMYEKAVDGYNKAIEINPDFANAHYGLGTAYSALRKTDEADKEFTIYRKLKSGQGLTKGAVASTSKTEKKSSSRKEKKEKSKSTKSRSEKRESSIKSKRKRGKSSFSGFSPKKSLKTVLTVPKITIKSPKAYAKKLAEMWDNSYIGKVFIGIVGFVGITQIWLVLVAFMGVLLWGMRKDKTSS